MKTSIGLPNLLAVPLASVFLSACAYFEGIIPSTAAPETTVPVAESATEPTEDTSPLDPVTSAGLVTGFGVPVVYETLDNGLKVVISPDYSVPTTTLGVYYGIGFRIEPRDRTGFAHLFEHMMFQGSKNLGKNEFISLVNSNGGILNGSTRFDFTNYFEVVPAHKTETFIWAEADRMRGLDITQENLTNQQGVVKNEVRVNVLNRPYGGFPWLDIPQLANENWFNAHNFYGDLEDLDAATLEDVEAFFDAFYAPNNAVVVIAGAVDPEEVMGWVKQYFGDIPASKNLKFPDVSEPRQEVEKRRTKIDKLAPNPALAWGYHMPERGTPEWYAMIVLDQILLQGDDSRLVKRLVDEKGYGGNTFGAINFLGNAFNYNGPMQWSGQIIHDAKHTPEEILADIDDVIKGVQTELVSEEELERAMTKFRSGLYDTLGDGNRIGLMDLLAVFALFDDNPARVNTLESEFDIVTPELIRSTAIEYLRSSNRSSIILKPVAADGQ